MAKPVKLDLRFTHPMEWGPLMEMAAPKKFGVLVDGQKRDLTDSLKASKIDGKTVWSAEFTPKFPGDAIFYVEPAPYWEKAERKYIIHMAKTVVDSMGSGEGWDKLVGLPVEIKPLTRPYGLYEGDVFSGQVLKDGKPVPFAEIEVEYYNEGKKASAPTEMHIAKVLKAGPDGVFVCALPRAGWWGVAALVDGPKTKGPDGKEAETELGALIWLKAYSWK
jgi:cobalt/nickel transport protein